VDGIQTLSLYLLDFPGCSHSFGASCTLYPFLLWLINLQPVGKLDVNYTRHGIYIRPMMVYLGDRRMKASVTMPLCTAFPKHFLYTFFIFMGARGLEPGRFKGPFRHKDNGIGNLFLLWATCAYNRIGSWAFHLLHGRWGRIKTSEHVWSIQQRYQLLVYQPFSLKKSYRMSNYSTRDLVTLPLFLTHTHSVTVTQNKLF
jgi:hypothetical protein